MHYYGESTKWGTLKNFLSETIKQVLKEDVTIEKFDEVGSMCVLFKIVSCPYCIEALRQWEQVEQHFKNRKDIHIATLDCNRHSAECHRFEVRRYPRILYIENSRDGLQQVDTFSEDRKASNIISYCERMLNTRRDASL